MKFRIISIAAFAILLFAFSPVKAANLSGIYSIPGMVAGTTVNNLTQLATLLNASTVSSTATFEFTSAYRDTLESFPIIFVAFSGTGNAIIRPAASVSSPLSTSGTPASNALIDFIGAKNLTFDGRPGGAGSTIDWRFQNTASSGSYPAFLFINGANHDTIEYLTILSSGTSSTGTVVLGTSTVAGGNSYNSVQYCNIGNYTAGYPYNPVLSLGTTGNENSSNSILYNNIYNYATFNNTGPFYAGINITNTGSGSNWNITGNSLYSTINPLALGSYTYEGIYFVPGSPSTGNVISANYIGGTQAQCGGTYWKVPAYGANGYADFDAIYINAGGTTTVTNNTIQNIWMASKYGSSTFRGINIINGSANVSGNMIGSATATSSILSGIYGTMVGIQNQSSSAVTVNNNTVAGFTSDGVSYVSGTSSTSNGCSIGIYGYSSNGILGPTTITNNKVYNFSRLDNYNYNLYFPINAGYGDFTYPIGGYWQNTIAGICVQSAASGGNQVISKNTVYDLRDSITGSNNTIYLNGIVVNLGAGTHTVNGNLVYGLHVLNNFGTVGSSFAGLTGLYFPTASAGTYNVTDNIIDLGLRPGDASSVANALISGIWDNTDDNNTALKFHINHNSVYIGGSNATSLNSYAFRRDFAYSSTVYDSLSLYNNVFVNDRTTTSGGGKNYGIYLNDILDASDDYNDSYGNGTNFYFGYAAADYVSRLAFTSSVTGHETHSISVDPQFISPATATPNLHILAGSPVDQAGFAGATIVYDFDSLIRANYSPVDLGATVVCSSASPASVTLAVSQDTICAGTLVTFTASPTNGGTTPNYNFYLNGVSVQNGSSATYANGNLNNNDSVKVVLTSSSSCASPAVATSNSIKVSVTSASTVPLVSIAPSLNNICHGTQVTFTATPTHGGASPAYNFYLNGTSVQNGANATYSNAALNNNDSVWVVMTSSASCLSTQTATSPKVHMVVNSVVVPSVSISPSANNICGGTPVLFTATSSNGGTPRYYWRKNGILTDSASSTYSDSTLLNGDVIKVTLISSALCATPDSAVSNAITMVVTTPLTPTIQITASPSGAICAGTPDTFSSVITNGGTASYKWLKNGGPVSTGASYIDNALASGDVIECILTTSLTCVTVDSAASNIITMAVNLIVTPTLSISASPSGPICANANVDFTAHGTNTGSSPVFQWKKNGVNAGTNVIYSDNALANGDMITCILTSNANCASQTVVGSDTITMTVNQPVTRMITTTICPGSGYLFKGQNLTQTGTYRDTATSAMGCDSFTVLNLSVFNTYTYFVDSFCNGNTYSFHGRTLAAAGTYYDTLFSVGGCDSILALTLSTSQNPVAVITSYGDSLSTTPASSYQWLLNGVPVSGANAQSYIAIQNGNYSVVVTSAGGCIDTSLAVVVVNVGINQLAGNLNIQVYPNPTPGLLNINVAGAAANTLYLKLFDVYGKLIRNMQQEITGKQHNTILDLNECAAGLYFLQVQLDGMSVTKRVELVK